MRFYGFDDIRASADCRRFVTEILGESLKGGRCRASWRGGDGLNVAVEHDQWYDHAEKRGGGIIELCAEARFGGNVQAAQQFLGEWLGLTPKQQTRKFEHNSRMEELLADGYTETARYDYCDLSGAVVHSVIRLQHPTKHKQFMQRTPDHWGLGDTVPILFNLAGWADSEWVAVVEGEKDVETMKALGLPATTNCGGAAKWRDEYSIHFTGKDVVILRDNDDAGNEHARVVCKALAGVARALRVLCVSRVPKGDVTDWVEKEGGTADKLMELIAAAPDIDPECAAGTEEDWVKAEAKKANKYPLDNFTMKKIQGKKGEEQVHVPRHITDIANDIHRRLLGFPRKIGSAQLFDHDRTTRKVEWMDGTASLFAWMQGKTGQLVRWRNGEGFVTKEEMYSGLIAAAQRYEAVSEVPNWPKRHDVFYSHEQLPDPSPDHAAFERLVDFFSPATSAHRTLLKAFLAAPLYYEDGVARPAWIIDSNDGPGTGKTTMVELNAELWGAAPIRTSKQALRNDLSDLIKRLVSADGRNARVLLVDNVTGKFAVSEFADLVTCKAISGKAPYGRGEETRPNNLTYVITSNSANVDNDTADRSYYIAVKRPRPSATWKSEVLAYIKQNRLSIIADIIDILKTHTPFEGIQPMSRFPEFETKVLQAMCRDVGEYSAAMEAVLRERAESNVEEDAAKQIEEVIRYRLQDLHVQPENDKAFVHTAVVEVWLREMNATIQEVYNYAKIGIIASIDHQTRRFPSSKEERRRGILWVGANATENTPVKVVGMSQQNKPSILMEWTPKNTTKNTSQNVEEII